MSRALELLKAQLEGGLTLTEAADRSGYSRTTVSLYAAGKYLGRPDGVEAALIRAFDVHHCPHTNEPVSGDVCQRKALAPKPFGGSERLAWWKTCQSCPHKPEPKPEPKTKKES